MFQRLLLLSLLVFGLAHAAHAQVTWEDVRPAGYSLRTMDVVWPSASIAYAVGMRNSLSDPMRSAVLRSEDAGDTWTTIGREGMDLHDIEAIDTATIVVTGTATSCFCGLSQRSTDEGATWTERTFPGVGAIRSVDFVNATTGFAVGDAGSIYKTTNGGVDWTSVGPGSAESVNFYEVSFGSANVGYAIAMYTALQEPNRLYKTSDGGATWTKILDQGTNPNTPVFYGLWAQGENNVFIAGRESVRAIFRSTNGGAQWTRAYTGLPVPIPAVMSKVEFTSDSTGYAIGDLGTIVRTTNGGIIWSREDPGTEQGMTGMGFKDRHTGIAGGFNGEFLKRVVVDLPTIDLSSESLNFGKMATGQKEMTLIVSAANSAGLTITDIELTDFDDAGFELVEPTDFPIELAAGEELEVIVRFTPVEDLNKRVFGTLAISTNDARTPVKTITLSADATTETVAAAIEVSTSNLDFGSIKERETKALSLEITAGTPTPLEIDSLWIRKVGPGGEAFELVTPKDGFPITITPGSKVIVTIRYAPMAPTEFAAAAELMILSNDPDNPELPVPLSGSAFVDPAGVEDETLASSLELAVTPQPATGEGRVTMTLAKPSHVTARLFDARGAHALTLVDRDLAAGAVALPLDASSLVPGSYTLVIVVDGRMVSRQVSVVR
jgi:photosystem II stability/assembly factor-like uncharacterized protein